jgi:hypothetical protein
LWNWSSDHYEFAVLDSSGEDSFVVKIPKKSVGKYSGWKYNRNGPVDFDVWYPSLQDKVSVNRWISSSNEIKESKNKPTKNDRQLSISICWGKITTPHVTLDKTNKFSKCKLKFLRKPYVEDGVVGDFNRYIYSHLGSPNLDITYIAETPIKGLHCITCVENKNCRIYGITDKGVPYQAVYTEKRLPQEVMSIHLAVGRYLESKRID